MLENIRNPIPFWGNLLITQRPRCLPRCTEVASGVLIEATMFTTTTGTPRSKISSLANEVNKCICVTITTYWEEIPLVVPPLIRDSAIQAEGGGGGGVAIVLYPQDFLSSSE